MHLLASLVDFEVVFLSLIRYFGPIHFLMVPLAMMSSIFGEGSLTMHEISFHRVIAFCKVFA